MPKVPSEQVVADHARRVRAAFEQSADAAGLVLAGSRTPGLRPVDIIERIQFLSYAYAALRRECDAFHASLGLLPEDLQRELRAATLAEIGPDAHVMFPGVIDMPEEDIS